LTKLETKTANFTITRPLPVHSQACGVQLRIYRPVDVLIFR